MAEARCLAVARHLAAQVPQDGLAEIAWKQIKREIESLPNFRYYAYGGHRRQDFQILPRTVK